MNERRENGERQLLVGAGKACIDPEPDMYPMPTRFGSCEALYKSCYCRAVAIDNGELRFLFLVYELSDWPMIADLKKQIAEAVGVKEEHMVIAVSHNHTSPCDYNPEGDPALEDFRQRYKRIEIEGAISSARQALSTLRPAKYGYGECISPINVNRDYQTPYGYWVEAPNEDGYSDKTLRMIKFEDLSGNLIAAILNHGTHAVNCFLHKDADGKTKLSGNFPGITCDFLEEYYGKGAVVLWTSGAAGNQDPIMCHGLQLEYPDGYSTQIQYPDGTGYLQMEYIGRRHAVDAVKGLDKVRVCSSYMPITHLKKDIFLPAQTFADPRQGQNVIRMAYQGERKLGTVPEPPCIPRMVDDPDHPVKMTMEILLLGFTAVICAGAEIYAQIGRDLREISPYKNTMIVVHTSWHVDYVLDQSSREAKVFQAFGPVKPGVSHQLIVESTEGMFEEILRFHN